MLKTRPQDGDTNWGVMLNEHLAQTLDVTGGINTDTSDPTLTSDDEGYTYVNTNTGELRKWDGSSWQVLINDTTDAASLSYDNSNSELNSNTLQEVIDEVVQNTESSKYLAVNSSGSLPNVNGENSIGIGEISITNSDDSISIGHIAVTGLNTEKAISIGYQAIIADNGIEAVQIGTGVNGEANTFQYKNIRIANDRVVTPLLLDDESSGSLSAEVGQISLPDVNTVSATVIPPLNPQPLDTFAVSDIYGNAGTNNITINFIANSINFHGTNQNYIINENMGYVQFIYINNTIGWIKQI